MNLPITIGEWTITWPSNPSYIDRGQAASIYGTVAILENGELHVIGRLINGEGDFVISKWNESDAKKFLQTHHALTNKNEIDYNQILDIALDLQNK